MGHYSDCYPTEAEKALAAIRKSEEMAFYTSFSARLTERALGDTSTVRGFGHTMLTLVANLQLGIGLSDPSHAAFFSYYRSQQMAYRTHEEDAAEMAEMVEWQSYIRGGRPDTEDEPTQTREVVAADEQGDYRSIEIVDTMHLPLMKLHRPVEMLHLLLPSYARHVTGDTKDVSRRTWQEQYNFSHRSDEVLVPTATMSLTHVTTLDSRRSVSTPAGLIIKAGSTEFFVTPILGNPKSFDVTQLS